MSNKSGIADNVISLPQGGGAQSGMGETFSPDLFTGTGNFSVPIAVPAGRNGFQPQLNLAYSTGSGNSAFGMGWGISVPGVMRKTNKGIPLYDDDKDVFILSGAEDLVPIEKTSETDNGITHIQWKYRPRTEGLFARIIHHKYSDGKDYWEVRSKDGLISYYGNPDNSEEDYLLNNPAVADNIFAWKLCKTVDPFGNSILYTYEKELIDDKEHLATQQYLKSIKYVNYDDGGTEKFLCSLLFSYEDRPDAFSEGRASFEVRTTKRCTQIETFTHPKDADLPEGYSPNVEGNSLLHKRYELRYRSELPLNGASLLEEIQVFAYDANTDETESMPALKFGYTEFNPASRDFFPVKGKALPQQSLAAPELELADLDGNGLPDFIEMNGRAVRYWKNQGNGSFALPQSMKEAPAFSLADPEVQLMDADGDGRIDLVVSKPAQNGYFPLNHNGKWDSKGMKRYKNAPSFSFADPEVKLLDLDGDGVTDVLRSGGKFENFYQNSYANGTLKAEGWSKANTSLRGQLESFPNVSFSNPKIKLADMNGDGMQDIVQVENGSIFYWPNLGHGKWGKRRTMKGGNGLKFPQQWDPRLVILGDVVGDGQADLIYVQNGEVHLWINQSGNQWSERIRIKGTPAVFEPDAVRLVDLLGSGVAGLLFTYNQGEGGIGNQRAYFLDFTSGTKPYVMNQMDNQMGAVTKVTYESSVKSWIKDNTNNSVTSSEAEKRPWKTTLPFPVQVVAKTEVIDQLSKGKLATEYCYSHGYWDGYEREFRGFGRVEQRDTETFQGFNAQNAGNFEAVSSLHYSPPTKTVNWFHLGGINNADPEDRQLFYEADFSDEYWQGDNNLLERSQATKDLLKSLAPHDRRDAYRAWRGSKLRTELYAADANGNFSSPLAQKPFTITEAVFGIRQEAFVHTSSPLSMTNAKAIFFSFFEASRTTNWERGTEPKTSFSFTADYDAYGQAQKQINIAVPRGKDPLTGNNLNSTESGKHHEGGYLCTYAESSFIHKDESSTYICDRLSEQKSFEVINDGNLSVFALRDVILDNTATLKVIAHQLNYYDGNAFSGLALGSIGDYGVLSRSESLYSTQSDITAAYTNLPEAFNTSGSPDWSAYPADYDIEWPNDRAGFEYKNSAPYETGFYRLTQQQQYDFQEIGSSTYGLTTAMKDAFNQEATVDFDTYGFLPLKVTDPIGMETIADYDYRILQANFVTDANENQTAFAFSPLGLLKATAVMGKTGDNDGDTLADPGTRMEYDFHAFANLGQPIWVKTIRREHHINDEINNDTITTIEYSDGFGRLLQSRVQAENVIYNDSLPADQESTNANAIGTKKSPSDPDNVVVNGHKVYNNKGKVVEQYEPYFDRGFDYRAKGIEGREFIEDLGKAVEAFISQHTESALNNESLLTTFLNSRLQLDYAAEEYIKLLSKHKIISNTLEMNDAEKIEVADAAQWAFGTGDFSVEFRCRFDQNINALVGNQTQHPSASSGFRVFIGDRRVFLAIGDGVNSAAIRHNYYLPTNEWYHIVAVKSTGNPSNWKIYKNGSLDSPVVVHNNNTNLDLNGMPVGNLFIGERIATRYLDGSIRDVRLYNRALTAQEIEDNYNAGEGNSPAITDGLVFNMPIDEGYGTTIKDYSSYGETGTLSGPNYEWLHHFNADWRDELPESKQKIRLFYDALDRPTQTLNPDGTAQLTVYGTPAASPNFTQATSGRIKIDYTPTPWESYAYDANDLGGITHPTETSSYSSHWNTPESNEIDALGRTIKTTQRLDSTPANDIVMQYEYDIQGRLTSVTDPEERENFTYTYPTVRLSGDEADSEQTSPEAEALSINHLDSGLKEQLFDARGALIQRTDEKGAQTIMSYDAIGRMVFLWAKDDSSSNLSLRELNIFGDNSSYGPATPKSNNLLGKVWKAYDEGGLKQIDDYDFKGNPISKIQSVIKDEAIESIFSSPPQDWQIDAYRVDWGAIDSIADLLATKTYTTTYTYDALNRIISTELPENTNAERKLIEAHYSRSGALQKVFFDGEEYVKEIAYNAKGQRLLIAYGNDIMSRYAYDDKNFRLLRQKTEKFNHNAETFSPQSGTTRQDTAYEYDLNGNILKTKERVSDCGIQGSVLGADALDRLFEYDAINRLKTASGRESQSNAESYRWQDAPKVGIPNASNVQAYSRTYSYDKVGNVLSMQQTGSNSFTRTFNYSNNYLQSIEVGGTPCNFTYDANGNRITANESRKYSWDHKDQLKSYVNQVNESEPTIYAHYLYDSSGQRVKKHIRTAGGNYEVIVYIDGMFEHRYNSQEEQTISHISDNEAKIATVYDGYDFDSLGETGLFNIQNHIGTNTIRLSSNGSLIDKEEFYPFGDSSLRTFDKKRYRYVGKEKDTESGLIYYGARYYAAWTCRFISVDKLANKYKQLTPYQNAGNSPISDYDIDGNQGKNTPKDGDKKQKSEKKSNDSSTEGGKDKNSVVNGNDSNEILNHYSVEHGKIELLPPEPDNPIESTPEDTLNTAKSELHEKELPKLPMEETEMSEIAEVIDPEMVEYEPQEQSKEEKKSFFNTVYSIASAYVQKTEKLLIKGGKQLARAAKFVGNAALGLGLLGVFISIGQSYNDISENGPNRENITKAVIGFGIAVLAAIPATAFIGAILAISYSFADDQGYIDLWIKQFYEGFDEIIYKTQKGFYDLEKGLQNGWRL